MPRVPRQEQTAHQIGLRPGQVTVSVTFSRGSQNRAVLRTAAKRIERRRGVTMLSGQGLAMMHPSWRWVFIAVVVAVYATSFFLPVTLDLPGLSVFIITGQAISGSGEKNLDWCFVVLGWSPNLLLWVGVGQLAIRRWWTAFTLGLIATAAACVWSLDSGWKLHFDYYSAGYYVWIASMALLAVFSLAFACCVKNNGRPKSVRPLRIQVPDASVGDHFVNPRDAPAPVSPDVRNTPV